MEGREEKRKMKGREKKDAREKLRQRQEKGGKGSRKLGELLKTLGACTFRQLLFEFDIN